MRTYPGGPKRAEHTFLQAALNGDRVHRQRAQSRGIAEAVARP